MRSRRRQEERKKAKRPPSEQSRFAMRRSRRRQAEKSKANSKPSCSGHQSSSPSNGDTFRLAQNVAAAHGTEDVSGFCDGDNDSTSETEDRPGAIRVGGLYDDQHNSTSDIMATENNLITAEVAPNMEELIQTEVQRQMRVGEEHTVIIVTDNGLTNTKRRWVVLAILLVVIAGGIAATMATNREDTSVALDPVSPFTSPSQKDCEAKRSGLNRTNSNDVYQEFEEKQFVVVFHVQLMATSDSSNATTMSADLLSVFGQQFQRMVRPELVGCSTIVSQNKLDYLIFDTAVLVAQDAESDCTLDEESAQPCHVINLSMDVWLVKDEEDLLVKAFILEVLRSLDLPAKLGLTREFESIEVQDVLLEPSPAPTAMSSLAPSAPTSLPSTVPTVLTRADELTAILAPHAPLNSQAMAWLTDIDTWEPYAADPNHHYLWLERYVMADLYFSTNGTSWTRKDNWLSPQPVCNWYFHAQPLCPGFLTTLDLWNNNLAGTIPSSIGSLSRLNLLELAANQLTSTIPSEIGNLSQLSRLGLYRNQLTSSIPSSIWSMSGLSLLFLDVNRLASSIPSSIGKKMSSLAVLNLDENQLIGSIPESITSLSLLAWLNLGNNQLTGTIPPSVESLSLTIFNMENNNLSGSIPVLPSSVTECNLFGNCFQDTSNGVSAGCTVDPASSNCP